MMKEHQIDIIIASKSPCNPVPDGHIHANNSTVRSPFYEQTDSPHFRHMFPWTTQVTGHVEY